VGLKLDQSEQKHVDKGFDIGVSFGTPTIKVADPRPFAKEAGLHSDDVLLEINGKSVVGKELDMSFGLFGEATSSLKSGDEIKLKVRRGKEEFEVTFKAGEFSTPAYKVVDSGSADAAMVELRKAWYDGKTK
jgi:C-terminal processing protease CtpA/Prc